MPALPRLVRRFLAIAALCGELGLGWLGVISPIRSAHDELDEHMERSLRLLSGYRQAIARRPALEARLADLERRAATQAGAVVSASAALAAAALQKDIRAMIDTGGGEIHSAQALPPTSAEGFETVELRYQLTVPMSALAPILDQIETHQPFLFLRDVDIRVPDYASPGGAAVPDPKLSIRWTLRGYRRIETP